ncbi:hypothetical protein DFR65_102334 [Oceanihabitans sediminis]|uniref:Glycosyl-4,4'-diaponeurosporenoate acyltransferase n=1 Tax=Oceanihabitans sediminis TaxID=1812012 RepID=A0A368P6H1_9FLAO|nr:hypothetical protein [Oceanihabitans sediminis]RBP32998.1 hypothetical protein DFR65_102334 [Oceanihabitans sediminis]RCU57485.1 hypothetical protein DU428_06730 [Oceanihabitans sediminis]
MDKENFGLTMKAAWKGYLLGKDKTNYRNYEKVHHSFEDLRLRLYKYNYYLFVVLIFGGFFIPESFLFLIFTFVWYKPICHALHLKNRVKRYNIELFKQIRGFDD